MRRVTYDLTSKAQLEILPQVKVGWPGPESSFYVPFDPYQREGQNGVLLESASWPNQKLLQKILLWPTVTWRWLPITWRKPPRCHMWYFFRWKWNNYQRSHVSCFIGNFESNGWCCFRALVWPYRVRSSNWPDVIFQNALFEVKSYINDASRWQKYLIS